jgi:sugar phosphate isomerase/epimerase
MDRSRTPRRGFLQSTAAAVGAAAAVGWLRFDASHGVLGQQAGGSTHPIRLGGPVFDMPSDPEGMALAHRKLGYRAAYCPGVGLNDKDRIRDISAAFAKHDVVIAEVGRWVNLTDSDPAKRDENLKTVSEGLALAEAIGARCCVDIAGSYNPKIWYGPDPRNYSQRFFDDVVENARKIIDAVKPTRAKFCYEMMGWAIPDSPDSYLKLIKAVDRPAFGVHLDPCNLINCPERFYDTTALLNECFDKLGPWIVSCHAKDLTWDVEMNIHFREVTIGTGSIDFTTYLKRVASLPKDVTLMIEHMANAEEYDKSRRCLLDLGRKAGISFGPR